jgi:hypothetical protein
MYGNSISYVAASRNDRMSTEGAEFPAATHRDDASPPRHQPVTVSRHAAVMALKGHS